MAPSTGRSRHVIQGQEALWGRSRVASGERLKQVGVGVTAVFSEGFRWGSLLCPPLRSFCVGFVPARSTRSHCSCFPGRAEGDQHDRFRLDLRYLRARSVHLVAHLRKTRTFSRDLDRFPRDQARLTRNASGVLFCARHLAMRPQSRKSSVVVFVRVCACRRCRANTAGCRTVLLQGSQQKSCEH